MSGVESENDYQATFAAYMLGRTLDETSAANETNATTSSKAIVSPDKAPSDRKWARLYYETMMRDWIPVRDNLVQVFDSLSQLHRQYILLSRHPQPVTLSRSDLELAISHVLLQQERLLAGVRQLLRQLHELQEFLQRLLPPLTVHPDALVDTAYHLFRESSAQFYALQCDGQALIGSLTSDEISPKKNGPPIDENDELCSAPLASQVARYWTQAVEQTALSRSTAESTCSVRGTAFWLGQLGDLLALNSKYPVNLDYPLKVTARNLST
jgi:hypothetical protein